MASSLVEHLRPGTRTDEVRCAPRSHEERVSRAEAAPLPHGRYGQVTEWDLANTRSRILTGLPMLPMPGWRW